MGVPERRSVPKRMFIRPKSVHAIEPDEGVIEVEVIEEEDVELDGMESSQKFSIAAATRTNRTGLTRSNKLNRSEERRRIETVKPVGTTVSDSPGVALEQGDAPLHADVMDFRCYGCNAPGVMKRNCPTCQRNQSKNVSTAL